MQSLSEYLVTLKADMGVFLGDDGERLIVVDETGSVLSGPDLLAVFALLVARAKPGAQVAVPVTAPSTIERILAEHGGGVTRTKTDVRSLMGNGGGG